jgi:hypothetical protein
VATIRTEELAQSGYPLEEIEDNTGLAPPNRTDDTTSDTDAPPKSRGFLLDAPEPEVAEWIEREVDRRQKAMDRRMVWAKANAAWRAGQRFVRVKERQDEAQIYVAPSTGNEPPVPNKCDQLVRRTVATLMVDPPKPDAVPASGDEIDRDAAEFATRALEHELEKMGYQARHEDALDKSFTYASAFEYFCVDPYGDRQPVEVLAHPMAEAAEPDPRVNPMTGLVEGPFVKKYVREDGTLTDKRGEAKQQWVPRIRMEVLNAPHVHFIPEYCAGDDDADGVICCYPTTLGDLRSKFESAEEPWPTEVLKELASYRPAKFEDLLPKFMDRGNVTDSSRWKNGVPPDDQVCFPFLVYMSQSSTYPEGAYVLSVGKKRVLHRDAWVADVTDQQGATRKEALPIPFAQVRNLDDHQSGDPYGTTVTRKLGQMDEMRALQIGAWLEFLDRFNHPREYLPLGSIIQPDDLNDRDGGPILYNPQGKPEFEQIPPFPPEAVNMLQFVSAEMDAESSLTGAQGNTSPNITSGYQQRQVIEQALVGLSGIKRNADRAFERGCRITLALMRGFFTVPQRLGYVSESGRYKEDEWSASDLGSTKDVKLRRGTSTMMAPSAKQALARDELEVGLKAQDPMAYQTYRRALASNTDAMIGALDDPIRLRVRSQIHEWEQGPEESVKAAPMPEPPPPPMDEMGQPLVDPNTGQPMPAMDPATGQPLPPPVHPMTEAARKLFAALPIDAEPLNARVRHEELTAAMAGARFQKHPPEWQAGLIEAYEAARQAAGVQTLAEQAQAARRQQEAEAEAEAAKEQQKVQGKMQAKAQEHEMERQLREQDAATDMERTRLEAAVSPPKRAA